MIGELLLSVAIAALAAGVFILMGQTHANVSWAYVVFGIAAFCGIKLLRMLLNVLNVPSSRSYNDNDSTFKAYFLRCLSLWPQKNAERDLNVLCIACAGGWNPAFGGSISDSLSQMSHSVLGWDDLETPLAFLRNGTPNRWKCLIIDIEGLADYRGLENVLEKIIAFRQQVPHIPVLLISQDFSRDEFGPHRLVAADASLAAPISPHRLKEGMVAASRNNMLWRNRCLHEFQEALAEEAENRSRLGGLAQ